MKVLGVLLLAVGVVSAQETPETKHWAVPVAGSRFYDNYRHQADVCHAYQILHAHGIPDERIIVFMFDDIANNELNPTKGVIINKPNGTNVYKGVLKDYTGNDVTPKNFLSVLRGDKQAMAGKGSGKVLESGPNDHVFVYFSDHGAPGFVAFPSGTLNAKDLISTLMYMHDQKMFKQLVFYMEACESGSMFVHLPKNISVFATTAAGRHESSYACYYDQSRGTYLGDVYSVKWMEDVDKYGLTETLQQQFKIVKKETTGSTVEEFGDLSFSNEHLSAFLSGKEHNPVDIKLKEMVRSYSSAESTITDAVPSPMVSIAILYNRLRAAKSEETKAAIRQKLSGELQLRNAIQQTMVQIVSGSVSSAAQSHHIIANKASPHNFDCLKPTVDTFSKYCFDVSQVEYALRQIRIFVNLCEEGIPAARVMDTIRSVCK